MCNKHDCSDKNDDEKASIILHVYQSSISSAYHTGIEVYGSEYYYDGGNSTDTGIMVQKPKYPPLGTKWVYYQSHTMSKNIKKTRQEIREIIADLRNVWRANDYHSTSNNGNHFSDAFVKALCGDHVSIPSYIEPSQLATNGNEHIAINIHQNKDDKKNNKWACSACTLYNNVDRHRCIVCGTIKPSSPYEPVTATDTDDDNKYSKSELQNHDQTTVLIHLYQQLHPYTPLSLIYQYANNKQDVDKGIKTIISIFQKIISFPNDPKFQDLNFNTINIKFANCKMCMNLLYDAGFYLSDDGKRLFFNMNYIDKLREIHDYLISNKNNRVNRGKNDAEIHSRITHYYGIQIDGMQYFYDRYPQIDGTGVIIHPATLQKDHRISTAQYVSAVPSSKRKDIITDFIMSWKAKDFHPIHKSSSHFCESLLRILSRDKATLPRDEEKHLGNENEWECDQCTFHNNIVSRRCVICDAERYGNDKNKAAEQHVIHQNITNDYNNQTEWKCKCCHAENDFVSVNCIACDAPRSGYDEKHPYPDDNPLRDIRSINSWWDIAAIMRQRKLDALDGQTVPLQPQKRHDSNAHKLKLTKTRPNKMNLNAAITSFDILNFSVDESVISKHDFFVVEQTNQPESNGIRSQRIVRAGTSM